jgi:hypothetical protein
MKIQVGGGDSFCQRNESRHANSKQFAGGGDSLKISDSMRLHQVGGQPPSGSLLFGIQGSQVWSNPVNGVSVQGCGRMARNFATKGSFTKTPLNNYEVKFSHGLNSIKSKSSRSTND